MTSPIPVSASLAWFGGRLDRLCRHAPVDNDGHRGLLVYQEREDVRPRIVADDVEVILAAGDLVEVL